MAGYFRKSWFTLQQDFGLLREKKDTPTLRFGLLNTQVTDVLSLNLPKVDESFPYFRETNSVFQMFDQIAESLFAGKNILSEIF